jgi:molybdenum cofactor biosynthesis enzyme MoaA
MPQRGLHLRVVVLRRHLEAHSHVGRHLLHMRLRPLLQRLQRLQVGLQGLAHGRQVRRERVKVRLHVWQRAPCCAACMRHRLQQLGRHASCLRVQSPMLVYLTVCVNAKARCWSLEAGQQSAVRTRQAGG